MSISTNIARAGGIGVLLVTAITATGISVAATSHADDNSTPAPSISNTYNVPAFHPWVPAFDPGCWRPMYYFNGHWHCG